MLTNEYSTLTSDNSKNSKRKVINVVLTLLLAVLGCGIFYLLFVHSTKLAISEKNVFNKNSKPFYPSNEEISEYRSKKVTIEYSESDLPSNTQNELFFDPSSETMINFHNQLISKHGYNSNDHNIQFRIKSIKSDVSTPMSCSTVYTYSYSSGFMEVSCDESDESITGCISYEPYTDGYRWGETGDSTSECYTYAYDTSFTRIDAKCCTDVTTSYSNYNSDSDSYCVFEECDSGDTAIGCTVSDSTDYTTGFSGTQRNERDYGSYSYSGCKGERSESGYLLVAPYCASVDSGSLDCYTVEGTTSELGSYYFSVVTCDNDDYVLTDCNAQIRYDIDGCTSSPTEIDWGINYGGWMYGSYCGAKGSSNIQAQATCCTIET